MKLCQLSMVDDQSIVVGSGTYFLFAISMELK